MLAPAGAAAPQAPHRRLRAIPDLRDGQVRLHLPEGFSYRSFHDTEFSVVLDDGTSLPGRHDGMGAFPGPDGNFLLVRNHEVTNSATATAFGPGTPYDARAGAGTTTVEVTKYGEVVSSYTSLNGTMFNCSGGRMPWGSWITCEETINGPDVGPGLHRGSRTPSSSRSTATSSRCRPTARATGSRSPGPGASPHEAVSFDPVDGILYLTEDNFEFAVGLLPLHPQEQPDGDRVPRQRGPAPDARHHRPAERASRGAAAARARRTASEWVDIDDPDPAFDSGAGHRTNDQALVKVGDQGRAQGAALLLAARGPGLRHQRRLLHLDPGRRRRRAGPRRPDDDDDNASGFGKGNGQVWAYHCRSQTLQVLYQAPVDDAEANLTFDFPDNITTSADGTLVVCEDSTVDNYIRGLSRGGQLWDIALNRLVSQLDQADRGTPTSSPARPSPPTATRCSSTSRPAAA